MNDVVKYVEIYQPDLRACINAIDQNTINNILQPLKMMQHMHMINLVK